MGVNKTLIFWVFIFLAIMLLQGCQGYEAPPDVTQAYSLKITQGATRNTTATPSQQIQMKHPTSTLLSSATQTPNPSPTGSITATATEPMQVIQLEVIDWKNTDLALNGAVVYSGNYVEPLHPEIEQLDTNSVIRNLQTGEQIVLAKAGEDWILHYAVSPDGQWLAYKVVEPNAMIIIASSDGQEVKRVPMQKDWVSFLWLPAW